MNCPICNILTKEYRCSNTKCSAYSHKVIEEVIECDNCEGYGQTMEMVCYGGPPLERWSTCEKCDGEGVLE